MPMYTGWVTNIAPRVKRLDSWLFVVLVGVVSDEGTDLKLYKVANEKIITHNVVNIG